MSLETNLSDFATAVGQKIKAIQEHQLALSIANDPLTVHTGTAQFVVMRNCTITTIRASVAVDKAPTGSNIIFDVNKNGVTIFSTQANRPTINESTTIGAATTPDVTSLNAGDVLTVDVDQVGSTLPGSLATLTIGMF